MLFLRLLILLAAVVVVATMVTQVIVPLFRGTKLFWIFRRSGQGRIEDLTSALAESRLENKAADLAAKLKPSKKKH